MSRIRLIEITQGDKEHIDHPVVIRWYVELYSPPHVVAEIGERWFINGNGRSMSRVGTSNEDRVLLLHMEQVLGCTRWCWFHHGYPDPHILICKPPDYQYQVYTFSQ